MVTNDSLKKAEEDLCATRADLVACNRELKDSLRQIETLQIQLTKGSFLFLFFFVINDVLAAGIVTLLTVGIAEAQRDEGRKELQLSRQQLEDMRNERDGSRNSGLALQATIKRSECDRQELARCLDEARKRISSKFLTFVAL